MPSKHLMPQRRNGTQRAARPIRKRVGDKWAHHFRPTEVPTVVRVLAAMTPLAAADGVPMPGKQESPQRSKPSIGVLRLGNGKGSKFFTKPA